MDIFRYRIITNLQCNQRCSFCYQTYKPPIGSDNVLSIEDMDRTMFKVHKKHGKLQRATLMGGETLLISNAPEYVMVAKQYVDTVCLVSNGTLLTDQLTDSLVGHGLDELAISISSISNFTRLIRQIYYANKVVPNMRVNIPRCEQSSGKQLEDLVGVCLDCDLGCVVCEDLMGRYGNPHTEVISEWNGVVEVSNDHNFITYLDTNRNKKFGLFAHYSGYNNTDVIITPIGNFTSWERYCNKVDNYALR